MKEYIREIINPRLSRQQNENRLKEYLQAYVLYILFKKKIYRELVFTGGTALRFLYKIKRFSEDLDFSLSQKAKDYNFLSLLKIIKNEFILSGYELEIKYSMEKNVHNAFLKFPGILYEFGLSEHKQEKVSIKVEIDVNPPAGGLEKLSVFRMVFMFYIHHYDLKSLFAGKVHALLCRKYTKGRDWYDLLWYLTSFKNLEPNFIMLNNAIKQTTPGSEKITPHNWKKKLKEKVMRINIDKARNDVKRFLEDPAESVLLSKKNLLAILD